MNVLVDLTVGGGWQSEFTSLPWFMLPVANRPLIDYWIELCVDLGVEGIKFLVDDAGVSVERYAGDGSRWGIPIDYGFNDWDGSLAVLARNPEAWHDGLLYICGPVFPARTESYNQSGLCLDDFVFADYEKDGCLFIGKGSHAVDRLLNGDLDSGETGFRTRGLEPVLINSIKGYFNLNMRLLRGEISRYLYPGYSVTSDGSYVGANTVISPASALRAPLIVGDNCKFFGMTTIGPNAMIGDRVIVDRQAEVSDCIVLPNSYIGRNIEIRGKILAGCNIVDPELEVCVPIVDTWVVDNTTSHRKCRCSSFAGYILVFLLLLLQLPAFVFLYLMRLIQQSAVHKFESKNGKEIEVRGWVAKRGSRLTTAVYRIFAIDKTALLLQVMQGNLYLCGTPVLSPGSEQLHSDLMKHTPGVFTYADLRTSESNPDGEALLDYLYYQWHCSLWEDLSILSGAFGRRIRELFSMKSVRLSR